MLLSLACAFDSGLLVTVAVVVPVGRLLGSSNTKTRRGHDPQGEMKGLNKTAGVHQSSLHIVTAL
jgi:hypothetical protein